MAAINCNPSAWLEAEDGQMQLPGSRTRLRVYLAKIVPSDWHALHGLHGLWQRRSLRSLEPEILLGMEVKAGPCLASPQNALQDGLPLELQA